MKTLLVTVLQRTIVLGLIVWLVGLFLLARQWGGW